MPKQIGHIALLLALCVGMYCPEASAIPPRNVWVDAGFGFPNLMFGEIQAKVNENWQVGFGYGFVPGLTSQMTTLTFEEQTVTLGAAGDFTIEPTAAMGLHSFVPFIRYFPGPSNFYVQLGVNLLQVSADITGPLVSTDPLFPAAALVNATVKMILPVPTISVGDIWAGEIYFFAINIGISYFMNPFSSVTINGGFPEALGDEESNQAALNELATGFTNGFASQLATFRTQYPVVPSINICFGFILSRAADNTRLAQPSVEETNLSLVRGGCGRRRLDNLGNIHDRRSVRGFHEYRVG